MKPCPEQRARQIMEKHWPKFQSFKWCSIPTSEMMRYAICWWWTTKVEETATDEMLKDLKEFRQIWSDWLNNKIIF